MNPGLILQMTANPFGRAWHNWFIPAAPDLPALLERVRLGDHSAFSLLYDAVAPAVFSTVQRVVRDPAMSEEVTQEVFVELWNSASRFDGGRASVTTWAVTIARRRAVDRVRREQSQRNRIEALSWQRADGSAAVDDDVVSTIEAQEVNRALAELPDDQRTVIELAFLDGLSHSVIAEQLGVPLGTVKGRVRGGLQRLNGRLGGGR